MENKTIVFDDLLSKVSTYTKDKKDLEIIKKAYEFGNAKYFGEKRLDGNGLIDHHLNVAMILTELKSDYQTISSALLHEVLDYNTTIDEVKSVFGEEISNLVSSISK